MKPLAIEFRPRRHSALRLRWFAGGAGALLLAVASVAWLPAPSAEAGSISTTAARPMPDAEEAAAIDDAIRLLNFPWGEAMAALESTCTQADGLLLLRVGADARQGILRIEGAASSHDAAQALPDRLRALPAVAGVALLRQASQDGLPGLPVRFSLQLQLRDPT